MRRIKAIENKIKESREWQELYSVMSPYNGKTVACVVSDGGAGRNIIAEVVGTLEVSDSPARIIIRTKDSAIYGFPMEKLELAKRGKTYTEVVSFRAYGVQYTIDLEI